MLFRHTHQSNSHFSLHSLLLTSAAVASQLVGSVHAQGCPPRPIPPALLRSNPLASVEDHPALSQAAGFVDQLLTGLTESLPSPELDSLFVSVISSGGDIWSKGYGRKHANVTEDTSVPDINTIYRIASVSKMFAAMETIIQRNKGHLNWDDPVEKFLPGFSYSPGGWSRKGASKNKVAPSITLRQLASHLSGLGREFPNLSWDDFPAGNVNLVQAPISQEDLLAGLATTPLVASPYSFPSYSNTGFALLGLSNLAAAKASESDAPGSYGDLLKRDIFDPLGMDSSSFSIDPSKLDDYAFSTTPDWLEADLGDTRAASGGQYSSTADLVKAMKMILNPDSEDSLLSPTDVKEWLRPINPWGEDVSEVGAPWEIFKLSDDNKRTQRYYAKTGDLIAYHALFVVNPELNFGVTLTTTGLSSAAFEVIFPIVQAFQPAFQAVLDSEANKTYAGNWTDGSSSFAGIEVANGSLMVRSLTVNGTDYLAAFGQNDTQFSLWPTDYTDEFRLAKDPGSLVGCTAVWGGFDSFYIHDAPNDLLYFEGEGDDRVLYYPAGNLALRRA